jgi:enterochelin esterase-like enzyme
MSPSVIDAVAAHISASVSKIRQNASLGTPDAPPPQPPLPKGAPLDYQYRLGPDSKPQVGVPRGELRGPYTLPCEVFPGTQHTYWLYVPAQYDPARASALMVFQDGQAFIDEHGDIRAQHVLDNLIYRREIPVMIAVFINPGRTPEQVEPSPAVGWGDGFTNRRIEYNAPEGGYSRVVCDELLPVIQSEFNIAKDPRMRGIGGSSSGAIAAFMVAWERPEEFTKVLSNVGSFTNIEGGHIYPDLVKAEPSTKPIRVFLCDGRNDNRSLNADGSYDPKRDWFLQNVRMQQALEEKGYDIAYTWGVNLHGQKFGGVAMPEMMRWLWRDCTPVITDPRDLSSRGYFVASTGADAPADQGDGSTQIAKSGYGRYEELLLDLETRGHSPTVLGVAPDGSPIVAIKGGGNKLPPIFLSAGAHSTEQAGVCAAVDLLDELRTEHELWVLPCRDPIGLSGFRHALHLGLPFETEPTVDTLEDVAALLRKRGTVLVDDSGEQLLVALLGEYCYAVYCDGRASSMLPTQFANKYPDAAAAMVGRRLWWPSNYDDVPGASPLERACASSPQATIAFKSAITLRSRCLCHL